MADEDELKRQLVLDAERDKKLRQEIEDAEKLVQVFSQALFPLGRWVRCTCLTWLTLYD